MYECMCSQASAAAVLSPFTVLDEFTMHQCARSRHSSFHTLLAARPSSLVMTGSLAAWCVGLDAPWE
jgi:hypothetical protein